jgi:hypothetical protein
MRLAFPKAQFWNLKFTKSKPACNLKPIHCALMGATGWPAISKLQASKFGRRQAHVGLRRQMRSAGRGVATVPEQMMGSVDSTFLGSNCFVDVGLNCARNGRALIGVAITAIVEIAAVETAATSGQLASTCERSNG